MNYITYVERKLNDVKISLGIENNIFVGEEQEFVKIKNFAPGNIYVVVKLLASSIAYDGRVQPVQLMVLSESNSLDIAKELMNEFATNNNLVSEIINGDLVKQTYNTPVVVSNFTEVSYGFKSLIYVSGTLFILENIIDLTELKIDGETVKVSSFNAVYAMTGNTQPVSNNYISSTVKSVSTFSCGFTIPMIGTYEMLLQKVLNIMSGNLSGNTSFAFNFNVTGSLSETATAYSNTSTYNVGDVVIYNSNFYKCIVKIETVESFNPAKWEFAGVNFSYNMKLTQAQFTTAPNSAPGLQLGFMV